MGDQSLLTEVPATLKRLAKYVVRGFYGVEYSLTLDILIRYPCVKEEDLQQLLKFEKKQLRSVLNTLKADKFLKSRIRVETNCEGKSSRHNYYYINYKLLVDVVKYKLDVVRRKIETDERNSSTRSSFKCPLCFSTFSDLEVNHLFDPCTGNFNCTYCHTEVEEDASAIPKRDARTILATFNEQIEPIYALLHETEDIALSHELLEPQPTEIPELALSQNQKIQNLKNNAHLERWSNKVCSDLYEQNIVVNVQESDVKTKKPVKPIKSQPIWMTTSTVDGAALDIVENAAEPAATETHDPSTNRNSKTSNYEVIKTLMIHEKKTLTGATVTSNANRSDADSETSESEDESKSARPLLNLQEEAFEREKPMVKVAGKLHLFSDISQNPELVALMTEQERESYISTCQEMFHLMYD